MSSLPKTANNYCGWCGMYAGYRRKFCRKTHGAMYRKYGRGRLTLLPGYRNLQGQFRIDTPWSELGPPRAAAKKRALMYCKRRHPLRGSNLRIRTRLVGKRLYVSRVCHACNLLRQAQYKTRKRRALSSLT